MVTGVNSVGSVAGVCYHFTMAVGMAILPMQNLQMSYYVNTQYGKVLRSYILYME